VDQRRFVSLMAAATAAAMAGALRRWFARCPCGADTPVTSFQGLDFKPGRTPRVERTCPKCRKVKVMKTVRK
jgi:hypothetical protein